MANLEKKNHMNNDCLFCKISAGSIPSETVYESGTLFAINDINPQAPIHILLIPKKLIKKLSDCSNDDKEILSHLFLTVGKITSNLNISDTFRININNGEGAGQEVFHLHIHILAGRKFNWPPG